MYLPLQAVYDKPYIEGCDYCSEAVEQGRVPRAVGILPHDTFRRGEANLQENGKRQLQ